MTKVYLKHNPYSGKTICKGNDNKDIVLEKCWESPESVSCFQDWVFNFFTELDLHENDDEYDIKFVGTPLDCKDIEDSANRFNQDNPKKKIILNCEKKKSSEDRIQKLRALFSEMQKDSPYDELKTLTVKNNFERALNAEEEIVVVAPISSGKSTLINAILGRELMPARHEATTAKIIKICNEKENKDIFAEVMNSEGEIIENFDKVSLEVLDKINKDDAAHTVKLNCNIPNINNYTLKLILTDTPGPNNGVVEDHRKYTESLIEAEHKPIILYVLDAGHQKETSDSELLNKIISFIKNREGKLQSRDRFLFVMNKADELDPQSEKDARSAVESLTEYLHDKGIKNAKIYPVSSKLSKCIRKKNNGYNLTDDETDFVEQRVKRIINDEKRQFSSLAPLSPAGKAEQDKKIQAAKDSGNKELLADIYSGIPAIEIAIGEYIEKYAINSKMRKAIDSFNDIVKNKNLKDETWKKIYESEDKLKQIKIELKKIQERLKKGEEKEKYENKINNLSILSNLEDLFTEIQRKLMECIGEAVDEFKRTTDEIGKITNYVDRDEAEKFLQDIETELKNLHPQYLADIEKALKTTIIKNCITLVDDYKNKFADMIEIDNFNIASADLENIIMPTGFESNKLAEAALEEVITGSNIENGVWSGGSSGLGIGTGIGFAVGGPLGALIGGGIGLISGVLTGGGIGAFINDKEDKVNIDKFTRNITEELLRKFDEDLNGIQKAGKSKEEEFRSFFKRELSKLDEAISFEVKKQNDKLSDSQKREETIKELKSNLEWLENFKSKLDEILSL